MLALDEADTTIPTIEIVDAETTQISGVLDQEMTQQATAVANVAKSDAVLESEPLQTRIATATARLPRPLPEGWAARVADNGKGIVFQRPGATGNADMIRVMDPTPSYADGYIRVYNSSGQPVDVFGKPGPNSTTHIPLDYSGEWSWWPAK
jgi:hypothetical protein